MRSGISKTTIGKKDIENKNDARNEQNNARNKTLENECIMLSMDLQAVKVTPSLNYGTKKKRLKKEEQGRKLSYVMKEFLVQKSCLNKPSTCTSTTTALDLANKNSVPPQSLPEEVVEESQKQHH
ncbi:hypothetical protein ILUMI_01439 [Ignelater luminosus]|uniref:Uncharacterized protein n=1 Tax=Ignelater luminosus TaxID=2038154 RepID=A0A8K0DID0_IGNLU|nr:hypothetical protein ILUMI_01439 [Ignelater luminosus]